MSKDTKITWKWFYICDYDKEEEYYSKMHSEGWKLTAKNKAAPYFGQRFERCEPENVVYKIGFNPVRKDRESYIQMFEDYGWEFVGEINDFYIFRKNAEGVSPEELDIFSDDESRLDMTKKVLRTKFPLIIIITFAILLPQSLRLISETQRDVFDWVMIVLYAVLWLLYAHIYIRTFFSYRRLKKRFNAE